MTPNRNRRTTNSGMPVLPPAYVLLVPVLITLLFWISSPNAVTLIQGVTALVLLVLPWWSYWDWRRTGFRGLPLLAIVSAMYWLYFCLHLFWGDRRPQSWRNAFRTVSDQAITETMLLAALGVFCVLLGMTSRLGRRIAPKRLPEFSRQTMTLGYVQGVALLGVVIQYYDALIWLGGEELRQVMIILGGTVSIAAFVYLLQRVVNGQAGVFEKWFLAFVGGARALLGISSGWVGSLLLLAMVCAFLYLQKKRKLPLVAMMLVVPYVLFLQAGKDRFRQQFWYQETDAGKLERLEFWMNASMQRWQQALNDPSGTEIQRLLSSSLNRTSLLTQAAKVLEQTPGIVPYQYGRLYTYLAVSLVPRFVWPSKPSVNEANRYYQVAYGLTPERDLGHISIAVGVLTEGYINFGWFGAAGVMFLVGVFLDFWNEAFLCGRDTTLAYAIGLTLLPQIISVEAQMAQLVSGLLQHVFLTVIVFLPVLHIARAHKAEPAATDALGVAAVRP